MLFSNNVTPQQSYVSKEKKEEAPKLEPVRSRNNDYDNTSNAYLHGGNSGNNRNYPRNSIHSNSSYSNDKKSNVINGTRKFQPTELCKYYLSNCCFKGDNCTFSHELRKFPCKFYHALGYCDKGHKCSFNHQRFNSDDEVNVFISHNIDFLNELICKIGRTNMDDFYFKYIRDRQSKVASNSNAMMIPNQFEPIPPPQMSRVVPQSLNPNQIELSPFLMPKIDKSIETHIMPPPTSTPVHMIPNQINPFQIASLIEAVIDKPKDPRISKHNST